MEFNKIIIVTNIRKDPQERFTKILKDWLEKQGKTVVCVYRLREEDLEGQDLLITLGGDGTIIDVAREVSRHATPILGINLGHLGFLAETEEYNAFSTLSEIFDGAYTIDKRMMLSAYRLKNDESVFLGSVLNEVVIKRQDISRMMSYTLRINGNLAGFYRADGVIMSTPTGSTAYNLSAGGPIIFPHCQNIAVTPICPHSLSARPLVLSANDLIEIEFDQLGGTDDLFVTLDGNERISVTRDAKIKVVKSEKTINLIRRERTNFFSVLKEKL